MVIGRPREFDSEQALDAAMHLFWRQGYEATSMQNLLDAMNLSKSSLYQTFGSKHDLFQRCLQQYRHMMTTGLVEELEQAATGRAFIERFFTAMAEKMKNPDNRIGCLVMNTASELAQRDEEIAKAIKQGTESFIKVFYTAVKQAQQEGEIPKDKDAQSLAHYLMSSLAGLNSMAKAGASQTVLKNISNQILQSLD
jgi:TetR/AcrR family transcriptional repressor of nem operon